MLEDTPLRGWRSWQAFANNVTQDMLEDTMRGLAQRRPKLAGSTFHSLAEAGYRDVGLDAGFEEHVGFGGSCHTKSGHLLINKTRFPSFKSMTGTAHSLNLTASWYLNLDPCPGKIEQKVGPTYATDSGDAVAYGFDGVKFDSEAFGPSHNITEWALALQKAASSAGKTQGVVIENCLNKNPTYILDKPEDCPFNHYRTGPDNAPDFYGGLWRIWYWTLPYLRVTSPTPASRPRCWAYPDMLGIGAPAYGSSAWSNARSKGCANMTIEEERSLFANWAIISSPLILGLDVRNDSEVMKYWPIIANQRALEINAAWVGSAGTLLKASQSMHNRTVQIGATCEALPRSVEMPDWLMYAKPLPNDVIAVLVINLEAVPLGSDVAISLEDLHGIASLGGSTAHHGMPTSFGASDVWTDATLSGITAEKPWSAAGLSGHNSTFVLFTPNQ